MKIDKYKIYLLIVLMVSFFVRLIPHRNMILATYDEYLHKDITLMLINKGYSSISTNIYALTGLEAYGYPPMFHVIGSLAYSLFPSDITFYVFSALCGVLSIFIFYFVSKELLDNKYSALLATILFAFAPNILYRTSIYIPENLGLVFFTFALLLLIKYLKYKKIQYLGFLVLLFPIYMITHRNWMIFLISSTIIILPYLTPYIKKYIKYILPIILAIVVGALLIPTSSGNMLTSLISRLPQNPVTLLGYFKWVGIVQLIFGIMAVKYYLESKNNINKGIALWALTFLAIGAVSFRFRDPYASYPIAIMASSYLFKYIPVISEKLKNILTIKYIPENIKNNSKKIISILLVLVVVLQGVQSIYSYIVPPTVNDKEAFQWICENTPKNSVFLTWWTTGYNLIGNTHRRDILTWKKVYQGYSGNPPTMSEVKQAYSDLIAMYGNHQVQNTYRLLNKYNVSYVYFDKIIRNYGLLKYGLSEYITYDTNFKLIFVNKNSEIYKYIPNNNFTPNYITIKYNNNSDKTNTKFVNYLEKFWTGYNYADFDNGYKGDFYINGKIANYYNNLYLKTNNMQFKNRSENIIKWLSIKQMDSGAYVDGIPPAEYTLSTSQTTNELIKYSKNNKNNKNDTYSFKSVDKALIFINNRLRKDKKENNIKYIEIYRGEKDKDKLYYVKLTPIVVELYKLNILSKNECDKYIDEIINQQDYLGRWGKSLDNTIAVSSKLCEYYYLTKNKNNNNYNYKKLIDAINKSSKYIKDQQKEDGTFKNDNKYIYSSATYGKTFLIYHTVGNKECADKEINIIKNKQPKLIYETKPLQATFDLLDTLSYVYGENKSMEIVSKILEDENNN